MNFRLCAALALALLAVSPRFATAADIGVPPVGQELAGRMLFLDGTVLLPPGQWFVAASELQRTAELDGAEVASVVLLQQASGHVGAVVFAQGNTAPLKARPSLSSECWNGNALFTAVAADDDSGGACASVLAVATRRQPGNGGAWDRALAFAAARGWRMPPAFMVAAFRSVDRRHLMDVRYASAMPDEPGASAGAPCAWAAKPAEADGEMRQMAQGMTNFATAMLAVAETAGHSRLPEIGDAPPLLAGADAPQDLVHRLRQARIDELVEHGSLSPEQARELSRRAAEPASGDPLVKQLLWRSGYKTLTYKASTYIDTTAVYYFFVPDLPLVLIGSAITNIVGWPIVYVNDFTWSYFGLQASRSKQPFALASLGDICPRR